MAEPEHGERHGERQRVRLPRPRLRLLLVVDLVADWLSVMLETPGAPGHVAVGANNDCWDVASCTSNVSPSIAVVIPGSAVYLGILTAQAARRVMLEMANKCRQPWDERLFLGCWNLAKVKEVPSSMPLTCIASKVQAQAFSKMVSIQFLQELTKSNGNV